jgi:histidinol-phosphate/aromatic aminotransferase/cobyric acid decarboxylase-like protein
MPTQRPAIAPPADGAACAHGGAFFDAIGPEFDDLERHHAVIAADVLDAWFPPAPAVLDALTRHADFLARTSPPTHAAGLAAVLARARGVPVEALLLGAGSSTLIYLALTTWIGPRARVLLCDPTYGEYAHVLERVVGCTVERLTLDPARWYRLDPEALAARIATGVDWVVLVNPNSPTGTWLAPDAVRALRRRAPAGTRFWIDETYVDYVDPAATLEPFAAARPDVVVVKSLSKAYALSGQRVAYLCGAPEALAGLRRRTPPWAVALPAQVAAVRALESTEYYRARWAETATLRAALRRELALLPGWDVREGVANFLLCHLPAAGPDAAMLLARARARGLYLRDVRSMGRSVDDRTVRLAVKDGATNARMVEILRACVAPSAEAVG